MIFPIIYPTAILFWMNCRNEKLINQLINEQPATVLPWQDESSPDDLLVKLIMQKLKLKAPICLLAPDPKLRRRSEIFSTTVSSGISSIKGFIPIGRIPWKKHGKESETFCDVYIASPELCFLQAAGKLPLVQLILFGYELCSGYVLDDQKEYGQKKREPITTTRKLFEFLALAEGVKGVQRARQALPYIIDGSGSPMETRLSVMATLPVSMGGYALKKPKLNDRVELSDQGKMILKRDSCLCDMVWEPEKLIGEYDSNLTHLKIHQHMTDKGRATALALSGYKVISITASDVQSLVRLEAIFLTIRKELGMRIDKKRQNAAREKREELFRILFCNYTLG